jgi:hypothetical protein
MKVWRHWPTYDDQHIQKLDLNVDFSESYDPKTNSKMIFTTDLL